MFDKGEFQMAAKPGSIYIGVGGWTFERGAGCSIRRR